MNKRNIYLNEDTKIDVQNRHAIEISLPDDLEDEVIQEISDYMASGNSAIYPNSDVLKKYSTSDPSAKIEAFFWICPVNSIEEVYPGCPEILLNAIRAACMDSEKNSPVDTGYVLIGFF